MNVRHYLDQPGNRRVHDEKLPLLETADLANGVKVTVKALNKAEVDWVRRETRDRDKEASAPGSAGRSSARTRLKSSISAA